jgi:hypothetical protein
MGEEINAKARRRKDRGQVPGAREERSFLEPGPWNLFALISSLFFRISHFVTGGNIMSTQFAQANSESRARLTALVEGLTEEQLRRPMPYAEIEATVTPELPAAIEASGTFFRMDRSLHRLGYMKDIEAVLRGM